ncbi:MAG: 3'(2'),5'-bisphosphate nucleotidase [Candidatus Omnitrophota bacterium]
MFEHEIETGKQAVIESMRLCRIIQQELTQGDSITKSDKSPVTIADFTSQAIICRTLAERFPHIPIVGEEHSGILQKPEHSDNVTKIWHYIETDDTIRRILNRDNLFASIDLGNGEPNDRMFWTLDPVDGTKGFLRGEQFAVALALIMDGKVQVGILGCPNLSLPGQHSAQGYLLYAVKGEGTRVVNVQTGSEWKTEISAIRNPEKMRFVESYESSHGNMDMQLQIARALKLEGDPVQMDSQVKYGVLATGNAEIYLRIPNPKTPDYKEKIWDHAAGSLIVEEAGGIVTDIFGKELNFNTGKTLKNNKGIFASVPSIHSRILEMIHSMA